LPIPNQFFALNHNSPDPKAFKTLLIPAKVVFSLAAVSLINLALLDYSSFG
jgi:hypothetical protein